MYIVVISRKMYVFISTFNPRISPVIVVYVRVNNEHYGGPIVLFWLLTKRVLERNLLAVLIIHDCSMTATSLFSVILRIIFLYLVLHYSTNIYVPGPTA